MKNEIKGNQMKQISMSFDEFEEEMKQNYNKGIDDGVKATMQLFWSLLVDSDNDIHLEKLLIFQQNVNFPKERYQEILSKLKEIK